MPRKRRLPPSEGSRKNADAMVPARKAPKPPITMAVEIDARLLPVIVAVVYWLSGFRL